MVQLKLNGALLRVSSAEELKAALERFERETHFELWASIPDGPALSMLRNGADAWLMYLPHPGDSGFTSRGTARPGNVQFRLTNGQVDEYPRAWCVDLEECYRAIEYFWTNDGDRPEGVKWHAADASADEGL